MALPQLVQLLAAAGVSDAVLRALHAAGHRGQGTDQMCKQIGVMATSGVAAHNTTAPLPRPHTCPLLELLLEQTVCTHLHSLPPAISLIHVWPHRLRLASAHSALQAAQAGVASAGVAVRGQAMGSCRCCRQETPRVWSSCTVQGHPVPTLHHTMAHLLLHGHHQRVLLLHEVGGKPGQGGILQQHMAHTIAEKPRAVRRFSKNLLPHCEAAAPAYPAPAP